MIFGDRDIRTFWHTKAVRFDTSYYTDFDRQEIVSNGLLRSFIEVPTVRKITVGIVTRGANKYAVNNRVREIADWLFETGTAKLFSDRDAERYFLARCTSVSVPKFGGASATFDAVFTCADYRPYDAATDQPIGDASTDLSNFTFGGKHCLNDMNCLFVIDSMTAVPKVKRNAYELSGQSGTLRYDGDVAMLEEKTLQGTMYFLSGAGETNAIMTPQEIAERQHEVAGWLIGAKRASLVLDSDTTRSHEAEIVDQCDLTFDGWANGKMKIKFVLQPYSTDVTQKQASGNLTFPSAGWQNFSLSDIASGIGYTTPLVVAITNNGSSAITDLKIEYYDENNSTKTMRLYGGGFSLSAGSTVTIDTLTYDVLIGTVSNLKFVKSGDFPVVTPSGTKSIRVYSSAAGTLAVTVTLKKRWL